MVSKRKFSEINKQSERLQNVFDRRKTISSSKESKLNDKKKRKRKVNIQDIVDNSTQFYDGPTPYSINLSTYSKSKRSSKMKNFRNNSYQNFDNSNQNLSNVENGLRERESVEEIKQEGSASSKRVSKITCEQKNKSHKVDRYQCQRKSSLYQNYNIRDVSSWTKKIDEKKKWIRTLELTESILIVGSVLFACIANDLYEKNELVLIQFKSDTSALVDVLRFINLIISFALIFIAILNYKKRKEIIKTKRKYAETIQENSFNNVFDQSTSGNLLNESRPTQTNYETSVERKEPVVISSDACYAPNLFCFLLKLVLFCIT